MMQMSLKIPYFRLSIWQLKYSGAQLLQPSFWLQKSLKSFTIWMRAFSRADCFVGHIQDVIDMSLRKRNYLCLRLTWGLFSFGLVLWFLRKSRQNCLKEDQYFYVHLQDNVSDTIIFFCMLKMLKSGKKKVKKLWHWYITQNLYVVIFDSWRSYIICFTACNMRIIRAQLPFFSKDIVAVS